LKKILSIVLLLLLLLGSGGAAAWWYYFQDGQEVVAEVIHSEPNPGYLTFEPFVVPVLQRNKVTHHLTMDLTLVFSTDELVPTAEYLEPRLKDAILSELHGLYNMRLVRDEGFDSPLVQDRIVLVSQRILGEGKVTGIRLYIVEKRKPAGA